MSSNIKTIIPTNCPHCNQGIFVEFINKSPELSTIFTVEDIHAAKEDARLRISHLGIDPEKKEQVLQWINDENTIFSTSEVDEIISSLLNENENDHPKTTTTS